jgi:sterol desaturase/sphingolipid hydroxylase (fatty acid hydroxylase superfamily)
MMSIRSLKNFFTVNFVVAGIAYLKSVVTNTFNSGVFGYIGAEIATSFGMLKFTDVNKPDIHQPRREIVTSLKYEPEMYTVMVSVLKGLTHYTIVSYGLAINNESLLRWWIVPFIAKSFFVEILFDGCHYFIHRAVHENKWLYKNIHRHHHTHIHTSSYSSFYMHPLELVLVYSVPLYVSLGVSHIVGMQFTNFEFWMLTVYLTLQEIGGHTGKKMYPTSSFAQCIWLPKTFGIELYTEDHDLHHTRYKCNYSKRFSLFDKLFGTYVKAINDNKNLLKL